MIQQVIIIGSGASINEIIKDPGLVERINSSFTIGINYSHLYFENNLNVCLDERFLDENLEDVSEKGMWLTTEERTQKLPENVIRMKTHRSLDIQNDLQNGLFIGASGCLSGVFALSIAVNFFHDCDIFLLGFDFGTISNAKDKEGKEITHHYQGELAHIGVGRTDYYRDRNKEKYTFEQFGGINNHRIYNVSPNSNLETFQKIDVDQFKKMLDGEYDEKKVNEHIEYKIKLGSINKSRKITMAKKSTKKPVADTAIEQDVEKDVENTEEPTVEEKSDNTNLPVKDNLLIAAIGEGSKHKNWIAGERNFDTIFIVYDKHMAKAFEEDGDLVVVEEGFKFQLIKKVLEENDLVDKYENIYMPDDDVEIDTDSINHLFDVMKINGIEIGQPSMEDINCINAHVVNKEGANIVFTNYIEIMNPVFSKDALSKVIEYFDENQLGFGYETLWNKLYDNPDDKFAVVHSVIATHTRPMRSGKNSIHKRVGKSEAKQLQEFMAKFELQPVTKEVYAD
jgi:hypothetical protein